MKWYLIPLIILLFLVSGFIFPQKTEAAISVIHNFAGMPTDGGNPCDLAECSLLLDNGVFYGVAEEGGPGNLGVIFKFNENGTGYTILREFSGGVNDGAQPRGSLIINGSVLYGVTYAGGDADYGTVYKINTDGTGFSLLHEFDLTNGANPASTLVLNGGVLYGTTSGGGGPQDGIIYKVGTDGSGFSVIKEFDNTTDGSMPLGIIIDTGVIYGMTTYGGSSNKGIIYKININGTSFSILRQFSGLASSGALPYGSLLMYQNKLYGMTNEGGSSNLGIILRINTDGTGFTVLHSFTGGTTEGQWPSSGLIENNGVFYGMTYYGGDNDFGTIFQMNADGSGFSTLHEFLGAPADGQNTSGNLVFNTSNSRLYGMTVYGGSSDNGIIFYYQTTVPTPTPTNSPTPTPSPTPGASTPTPTSGSGSSSGSSVSSSTESTVCTNPPPSSSPNLFQVNVSNTTATLFFSSAKKPYNSYYVSFGNGNNDQGYGVGFSQGPTNGVITFTVSNLSPNSLYSFKVRAANGCMPGNWSRSVSAKTTSIKTKTNKYFPDSGISYLINYSLPKQVQKIKDKIPFVKNTSVVKVKKAEGVKKVINQAEPVQKKSLLQRIFSNF